MHAHVGELPLPNRADEISADDGVGVPRPAESPLPADADTCVREPAHNVVAHRRAVGCLHQHAASLAPDVPTILEGAVRETDVMGVARLAADAHAASP